MSKIKVYNKKDMILASKKINLFSGLFFADKMTEIEDAIYIYNEPSDDFLHSKNIILCGTTVVDFGDFKRNVIVYDSSFYKLPKFVKEAFIQHEVGRIKNNDHILSEKEANKLIIKRLLGILPKMEINADKYAASVIGVDKVKNALSFMINKTNIPFNVRVEFARRYHKL